MENAATIEDTLSDLRKRSGMTISQIIEQATKLDPSFPQTHAGFLGIESLGTKDYYKIRALAAVFDMPADRMAPILHPRK